MVAEFVVLFLAVSLSFVAEDLRENWRERRDALVVLEAIRQDLGTDLPIVRNVLELDSAAAAAAQWLHRNWERATLPSDSVGLALQAQYFARVYSPVRAAYESAKGAGRLDFISDPGLRLLIGTHYETGQGEEKAVNELVLSSVLELHGALRPYLSFGTDFPPLCCAADVSLAVPWATLRADRQLRNTLLGSEMFRRLSAARMRAYEGAIQQLQERITTELASR